MSTRTYSAQNILVSLTTSDGDRDFNMHSSTVSHVEDKSGGGSIVTFTSIPLTPSESAVSGTTVTLGNTGLTTDVNQSVAEIDALVIAAGGTVET